MVLYTYTNTYLCTLQTWSTISCAYAQMYNTALLKCVGPATMTNSFDFGNKASYETYLSLAKQTTTKKARPNNQYGNCI